jgi:DNA-directed RNA polymerase subunit N (RpoN/RPB10)
MEFLSSTVVTALVGVLTSAIAALFSVYKRRLELREVEIEKERLKRATDELGINLGFIEIKPENEKESGLQSELLKQIEDKLELRLKGISPASEEKLKSEISKEFQQFKERIEKIERRFPDEAQIDKVASINDALLSQRIDQLKERIDKMEEKIPSKWDIALTVSAILGGICAVVAATYGVIQFITQAHSK